ncbi:MAG: zinc-binding dehydrogenase [Rhodospirillales bacterium]|nr:zinc-binding dehydrogenase [Rhodospirillales bacterium]
MRAVFIHGEKDLRLGETPDAEPKADEYLLKVASVLVCGSDLHYYMEGKLGTRLIENPQIPGHEIAAWIWDDRAEELGLEKGQLVAVEPSRFCGECHYCKIGIPNLCTSIKFQGSPPNHGAMTQYITAPKEAIFAVPDHFTPEMTAALEPIGIGVHALKKADLQLADSVAILGCGPIGLVLLQLVRAHGAGKVYCVDPIDYRAQKAAELGADKVGSSYGEIIEWTGGIGCDLVIEATTSPDAFAESIAVVKSAGRIVLVGIPTGVNYSEMNAMPFRSKEPTVKICNRMGEVFPEAIELVLRGKIDVGALITHRGTMDDAIEIFERQGGHKDGVLKSALYPNGYPD